MIRLFLAFEHALNRAVTALAAAALVLASCCAFYQVITRFVFEQPSTWSEALTRTLLIWMVLLGCMVAFRRGALMSVDLAYRKSRGAWRHALQAFISLSSLALLGVIIWYGYLLTMRVRFQVLAGMEVSIAWAYAALPVGGVFAFIAVLAHWIDYRNAELDTAQ
jgi:C4-dicarboxylate transporter, DctQ subunit